MIDAAVLLWAAVYAACAAIGVARHVARRRRPPPSPPDVDLARIVLVRPCAGDEPGLAARLAETGGARNVVLAVGSFADEATPAASRAVHDLLRGGARADLVETHAVGPNHKVDQIARALAVAATARGRDVVVIADSDVDLRGFDLARFVAPLAMPSVGAVWAPPVEDGAVVTRGDAVSHAVLGASLHAFPLLAGIDPKGMVGKLFAVRRDALERVGGFAALRAHLGEDMELARRIRAEGLDVVASPFVARARATGRSLAAVHARYVRWLQVVRAQRTSLLASYPLLLAPAPLFVIAALVGASAGHEPVALAGFAGLAVRLAVAVAARLAAGLAPAPVTAATQALVADVALLAALGGALRSRRVAWRRVELELDASGKLVGPAR